MLSELVGKKEDVCTVLPRSLGKGMIVGEQERIRRKVHRDDHLWAVKMETSMVACWVWTLAAKSDDLSSIPGTHTVRE